MKDSGAYPGLGSVPPGYGLDNGQNRQLSSSSQEKSGTTGSAGPTYSKDDSISPTLGSLPPGYGVIGNKYASFQGGDSALKEVEDHINNSAPHAYSGTTHHPIKKSI